MLENWESDHISVRPPLENNSVLLRKCDLSVIFQAIVTIYRLFSTLGTIQVAYTTRNTSTASPGQDYLDTSSTLTLVDGEYRKEIRVTIINDNIPELDEIFTVQLTSVTGGKESLLWIKSKFIHPCTGYTHACRAVSAFTFCGNRWLIISQQHWSLTSGSTLFDNWKSWRKKTVCF